ncbi:MULTISPECIES: adenylate kinase family protein [Nostocales]|uniref:Adenylate kinase n=3 Tax=Nostocales TaxID=1161 RepID=A0A0C1N4C2_9CYAN|nr:nucleoside monophosphate kinase [Tolypothrix bouteillei]KAF3883706.1 nucleoside monophosphate kinase [Tolypothrix bouteillei VB521301]
MRLVILGGSGSGKSTQAHRLSKYFEVPLVSVGEILRSAIANLTDLGRFAQPYVDMGELVPDEIMIEFISKQLTKHDVDCGWVLEGYPRTAFQAEELDFLLEGLGQKLDWAIYLQVSQAVMVTRSVERSLPDDLPEIVQRRVELFYDRTVPILEYYDRRRRLLTINGDQLPEMVQHSIVSLLCKPS